MSVAAVVAMGALGAICGSGLYLLSKRYAFEMDERIDRVLEVLPGANCGACGFGSCQAFAEVVVKSVDEVEKIPRCIQGGNEVASEIETILGVYPEKPEKQISTLRCSGGTRCLDRFDYVGVEDCKEVVFLNQEGDKECRFACLGHGTCARTCPFDAINMGESGLPVIDKYLCRGCGLCVKECPRGLWKLAKFDENFFVACSSNDPGKVVKHVCEIGCTACKICEKNCPAEAVKVIDNLAVIDSRKCTGCGICAEKCPRGVILSI
jgi:electron transport complex protein RnfB